MNVLLSLTGLALRAVLFFGGELSSQEVSMRFTAIPECIVVLGLATLLSAQTKISGTVQCGKSDEQHKSSSHTKDFVDPQGRHTRAGT